MKVEDKRFLSVNKVNHIHVRVWYPDCEAEDIRGIMQIAHGMIDHIGRYSDMAEYFAEKGYIVVGNDHLGHGKSVLSKEDLGYFTEKNPSACVVEDMYRLTRIMKKEYPHLPYILVGHSMGSFLSRRYMSEYGHELDCAVLLGTGNQSYAVVKAGRLMAHAANKLKGPRFRSEFLSNVMFGAYNKRIPNSVTSKDWVCANSDVIKKYLEDELCDFIFTNNGYVTLMDTLNYIKNPINIHRIPKELPVLLAAGMEDPVGGYGKDVKRLFDIYSRHLEDVELRLYEECRHELHNEEINKEVFDDIYQWLEDRLD